jgi:hypothetical protein
MSLAGWIRVTASRRRAFVGRAGGRIRTGDPVLVKGGREPFYKARKPSRRRGLNRDLLLTIVVVGRSRNARHNAIFGSLIGVLPPSVRGQMRTSEDK